MAKQRKSLKTQVLLEDQRGAKKSPSRQANLNRPQEETTFPTLKVVGYVRYAQENVSDFSEFHMTIRSKISNLGPRAMSMLLAVACYRAVYFGVDIILYLVLEFLANGLRKSGQDPMTIKSDKIRKTVMLADVILTYVRGNWLNFASTEPLPKDVVEEILRLGWLPSERTMQSWQKHWNLGKYIEARIVPVEAILNRNEFQTAERYTAYTKGYGNDGSPANPGKTKPTRELDGDDSEDPPPSITLQEFEEYQTVIRLIEYSKAKRKQE
jgi:hypothetical protein